MMKSNRRIAVAAVSLIFLATQNEAFAGTITVTWQHGSQLGTSTSAQFGHTYELSGTVMEWDDALNEGNGGFKTISEPESVVTSGAWYYGFAPTAPPGAGDRLRRARVYIRRLAGV